MLYSTREASEASGISVDTVRYYCKIGLVPRVMRDENNYRVFDEHDIAWLRGLRCLRECGMGIDQMREYMELCLEGEGSIAQRKDILKDQRHVVEDKIANLRDMLAFIDSKLSYYDKVRVGEIEYESSLLTPVKDQ
ncbi:MerR family transcriptional regulator [Corynebacterium kroppenstedtii]|uniref:MerR family transcriptional regulator n=1 Tax=Corynebacterium kroppenstedtii TaxID=161879 RepID=UPI003873C017